MRKPQKRNFNQNQNEPEHRINKQIRAYEVRLVGDNVKVGIYHIDQALRIAKEQRLDLVEISTNSTPPVCKIIDYSKFRYEVKKRQKEMKAKSQKTVVKEIRFGPNTDEHDLNFKVKHAIAFLEEGNKVRAFVQFWGRSIIYKTKGEELLNKFIKRLEDYGKVEQDIKMEGRRMSIMLVPQKTVKKS